jgi:hypothetical protein
MNEYIWMLWAILAIRTVSWVLKNPRILAFSGPHRSNRRAPSVDVLASRRKLGQVANGSAPMMNLELVCASSLQSTRWLEFASDLFGNKKASGNFLIKFARLRSDAELSLDTGNRAQGTDLESRMSNCYCRAISATFISRGNLNLLKLK